MNSEVGRGLQVLHKEELDHLGVRVSVLGCDGLSKLVVVERPETLGGTQQGDLFLGTENPRLLPATIGDLLMALGKYQTSLEGENRLLRETEIETIDHLQKAYARALELVARDGELRSLTELFIDSVMECSPLHE